MEVLNEIYGQYLSLLGKAKAYGLDETAYFLELAGQVFEKEAFRLLPKAKEEPSRAPKVEPSEKKPPNRSMVLFIKKSIKAFTDKRV